MQHPANGGEQCPDITQVRNCSCVECPGSEKASNDATSGNNAGSIAFPEPGSDDYIHLKKYCGGVAEDADALRRIFIEQGGFESAIEYCIEASSAPDGYPEEWSDELHALEKACMTRDPMKLKEHFANAGGLKEAIAECHESEGLPSGPHNESLEGNLHNNAFEGGNFRNEGNSHNEGANVPEVNNVAPAAGPLRGQVATETFVNALLARRCPLSIQR
jgi:hypothetical protein